MRLLMAIRSRDFSVETMYNSNSNKVDDIRITHNNTSIGNRDNINRIVRTSSNPSINAKCVYHQVVRRCPPTTYNIY